MKKGLHYGPGGDGMSQATPIKTPSDLGCETPGCDEVVKGQEFPLDSSFWTGHPKGGQP